MYNETLPAAALAFLGLDKSRITDRKNLLVVELGVSTFEYIHFREIRQMLMGSGQNESLKVAHPPRDSIAVNW